MKRRKLSKKSLDKLVKRLIGLVTKVASCVKEQHFEQAADTVDEIKSLLYKQHMDTLYGLLEYDFDKSTLKRILGSIRSKNLFDSGDILNSENCNYDPMRIPEKVAWLFYDPPISHTDSYNYAVMGLTENMKDELELNQLEIELNKILKNESQKRVFFGEAFILNDSESKESNWMIYPNIDGVEEMFFRPLSLPGKVEKITVKRVKGVIVVKFLSDKRFTTLLCNHFHIQDFAPQITARLDCKEYEHKDFMRLFHVQKSLEDLFNGRVDSVAINITHMLGNLPESLMISTHERTARIEMIKGVPVLRWREDDQDCLWAIFPEGSTSHYRHGKAVANLLFRSKEDDSYLLLGIHGPISVKEGSKLKMIS